MESRQIDQVPAGQASVGARVLEADALSEVLALVRLTGCVYFLRDFAAPWGMNLDAGPHAQFHLVVDGACWLSAHGERRELGAGDIVVLPFGAEHALADTPEMPPETPPETPFVPGRQVLEAHQRGTPIFDGAGKRTRLLCGHFGFDRGVPHPLIRELPPLIHLRRTGAERPAWLEAAMGLLVNESGSGAPGAEAVVDRMAEVLFIHVLRAHLAATGTRRGYLAALYDARLGRAIRTIHARADRPLSLAEIADSAGMSRSSLAERFKDMVGLTPGAYLTNWRMLRARALLRANGQSVSQVAEAVGYASEAAFSRAFRKTFGMSPGAARRSKASEEAL